MHAMRICPALLALSLPIAALAAGPNVVVTAFPKGMVQVAGGAAASDSFTIANFGTADAVVTFSRSGNFFSIQQSGALLAPGASQAVTIRGTSQNGGAPLNGTVTISGSGVPPNGISIPVRLMSGPIPAGTVDPQPLISTASVNGAPDQAHTGSVSFHNNGNATMQGIVVSDTSWIVPQQDLVTIAGSRNGQATFTIDPT